MDTCFLLQPLPSSPVPLSPSSASSSISSSGGGVTVGNTSHPLGLLGPPQNRTGSALRYVVPATSSLASRRSRPSVAQRGLKILVSSDRDSARLKSKSSNYTLRSIAEKDPYPPTPTLSLLSHQAPLSPTLLAVPSRPPSVRAPQKDGPSRAGPTSPTQAEHSLSAKDSFLSLRND